MQPKVSLIVPHWPVSVVHDDLLRNCIRSMPELYEKIIVVNDGTGMGQAINKGLELATGDYLLVSNNDCVWQGESIRVMCDANAITVPHQMQGQLDNVPRAFYCMPRWVYERVGGYDEQFEVAYFDDDDLIRRWREAGVPFKPVNVPVFHAPGSTLNKMDNRNELFERNKQRFLAKWGSLPDEV